MSDYLTRLVERSMGVAPQKIEPLIAPLHSAPEQVLIEQEETAVAPSPAAARAKNETPLPEITPDDVRKGESEETSLPRTESPRPSAARESPEAPAEFAARSNPGRSEPHEPVRQTFSPSTPKTPQPASPPVAPSAIAPGNTRTALRPEITEAPPPVPASRESVQSPPNKSRPGVQPAFIGQRPTAARSSEPREQLMANPPPAIHVTIGRVEVRAVMAPAPPPKAATPPAPKISLEEYLKQRNGGRS